MAIEAKRGCGYRKVGGLYLVCPPGGFECDRLPIPTTVCPCCGQGIKPSRGWTWVFPHNLLDGDHMIEINKKLRYERHRCPENNCPVCRPMQMGRRAGLMWVGDQFYTTTSFMQEALELGVSKRIAAVPQGLVLGKTWVLLGHRHACVIEKNTVIGHEYGPGIFTAFKPTRLEKIVTETQAQDENEMVKLKRRGITPVIVPNDDPDHQ